jgi:PadR family transcriptional regulator
MHDDRGEREPQPPHACHRSQHEIQPAERECVDHATRRGDNHRTGEIDPKDVPAEPRHVAMGSVYITLERLERKGLVTSRLGEPTAERGGRAKTYFRITAEGLREAKRARQTLINLWQGVTKLEGRIA